VTLPVAFNAMMNLTCRSIVQPSRRMLRGGEEGGAEVGAGESLLSIREDGAGEILIGKDLLKGREALSPR
jgi:hypothetical protein